MKAQSKNRKSPTCSRCRSHGERDVRVLQHKCPYKDCSCSDCLLVKKRSIIYRAQKNLDKQDENSNGDVSPPGSGSTGSTRCLGSPQIPMHPQNADIGEANGPNPWNHHLPINNTHPPKNVGYSNIKNFQTLCLTFPDHSPTQLQTLFEQCGNDFEKTIDKILMSKWYSETSTNEYPVSNEPPTYTNNNNHNHNHNHNNSNDYPNMKEEDDSRSSFANCHYNQPNQRMMTTPTFHNQDYAGEEMVNRAQPVNSHNAMVPGSEWNYVDTSRYSSSYQNTWTQGEYSNWANNSNFWNNNNGHSYSYPEQNASNMGYFYGRRDMEYQDSGHLDRVQRPEIGSNISSNFDFDSY